MPRDDLIQIRRGTTAEWLAADPVLADGEPGWDETAAQLKVGNGVDVWTALPYETPPDTVSSVNGQSGMVVLDATDVGADPAGAAAAAQTAAQSFATAAVGVEAAARANADTTEATTRASADTALAGNIAAEVAAREALEAGLPATFATLTTLDARLPVSELKAFGTVDATGATDMKPVLTAAMTALNLAWLGTGVTQVLKLPVGTLRTDSAFEWKSGVWVRGEATDLTTIKPSVLHTASSVLWNLGNDTTPLTNAAVTDLTIDGEDQTYSVYDVGRKGIYVEFHENVRYERLHIKNTLATGLGVDHFHGNCIVANNIVENCGRANSGSDAGGNGIGLGTGGFPDGIDSVLVTGNYVTGSARFGIMVERQDYGYAGRGVRIIGNYCTDNQNGIVDCGAEGVIITGNQCHGNTGYGIGVNAGTFAGAGGNPRPGSLGLIASNVCAHNGSHGIAFDYASKLPARDGYLVNGNVLYDNTGNGIRVAVAAGATYALGIRGNTIRRNLGPGILCSGGTGTTAYLIDLVIESNDVSENMVSGIVLECNTTNARVQGNECHDRQTSVTQTKGVRIMGTHIDLQLLDNDLKTMATPVNFDPSNTITTPIYRNNAGFNPRGVVERTITASPMTYTSGGAPETLYIVGGTVTSVSKGGINLFNTAVGDAKVPINMEPNETVIITYSAAPSNIRSDRH